MSIKPWDCAAVRIRLGQRVKSVVVRVMFSGVLDSWSRNLCPPQPPLYRFVVLFSRVRAGLRVVVVFVIVVVVIFLLFEGDDIACKCPRIEANLKYIEY